MDFEEGDGTESRNVDFQLDNDKAERPRRYLHIPKHISA
jgi:hypothetical protein